MIELVNDDYKLYSQLVGKLRNFFTDRKYIEVECQSKPSILAACEDPKTVGKYRSGGVEYSLPQTNQMWLEVFLLKNPQEPGFFTTTTSYRDEPNPVPGRHNRIFPMWEFESKGNFMGLMHLEECLLDELGFSPPVTLDYEWVCKYYKISEITAEYELRMWKDFGSVIFLTGFPERTSPFWNMKHRGDGVYNKCDVILYGMETIGSAQRSVNVREMNEKFHTVSDGEYAKILYNIFGKDRVEEELNEFLSLPMIPRFGAGMGMTRLLRAYKFLNG